MKVQQEELQLFPIPSFADIIERRGIVNLTVQINTRLHKSWNLTIKPDKQRILTLPAVFNRAPEEIKQMLLSWALLIKPRLKKNRKLYYQRKRLLEKEIWDYLSNNSASFKKRNNLKQENLSFCTKGNKYDLKNLFDTINSTYFHGTIKSHIRWGSFASKTSYQSFKHDHLGQQFSIITIAGVYDHPKVPLFAIQSVIFHEMLHIKIPPYKQNGRNVIHGPEFKQAERLFPYYKQWCEWEKKVFHRLVRSMKKL